MNSLIDIARNTQTKKEALPFSIVASVKEQRIINLPVNSPSIIFVLDGKKEIGKEQDIICSEGSFLFLSNNANLDIRNIPNSGGYFALIIEFDYDDFEQLDSSLISSKKYLHGEITPPLEETLKQFVEWSSFAPPEIWPLRKRELLHFLYHSGYKEINSLVEIPGITQKLQKIIMENLPNNLNTADLASLVYMSESTLRRKLKAEGTNIKVIRDRAKLGYGLHLVQTTMKPIGQISETCGYQSQWFFGIFRGGPQDIVLSNCPEMMSECYVSQLSNPSGYT